MAVHPTQRDVFGGDSLIEGKPFLFVTQQFTESCSRDGPEHAQNDLSEHKTQPVLSFVVHQPYDIVAWEGSPIGSKLHFVLVSADAGAKFIHRESRRGDESRPDTLPPTSSHKN